MTASFSRYAAALTAAWALLIPSAPSRAVEERDCYVPESFYEFEPLLTKTAKALASGDRVVIVALGGASTVGLAASGAGLAWPAQMGSALSRNFPSAQVRVINLSVGRQTAKRGAERLENDVMTLKPTVVIWETGTMEAVLGTAVDEFRETLQAGLGKLRAARIELILMDMQFSRYTEAMIRFEPYLLTMRQVADAHDVPLFHRHGIMRHWAETGLLSLRARGDEKHRQIAAKLYDCVGRAMADFIKRGVHKNDSATGSARER